MKNVKFFVLLCVIVMTVQPSFNKVFGQVDQAERKWLAEMDAKGQYGERGNDSIACMQLLSQFNEFCKQQAWDKAYPSWSALFNKYPKSSQAIYSYGVYIIKKKMVDVKTGKEQQIWVDTLMLLYDRRIHFWAAKNKLYDEGYLLGRKGCDMLRFRKEPIENPYNTLSKSIELRGEKSEFAVIQCAMQATTDMYNAHKISAEVVKGNYQNYIKLLTAIKNKVSKDADIATAEQVLIKINELYSSLNLGDVIASASDNTAKPINSPTTQTASNNVSSAYNRTATTSTAPAYSQAEYERKCNEIKKKYDANHSSVEEEVKKYEEYVNKVFYAYHSSVGWDGKSKVVITSSHVMSQLNLAVSIAKKTIDPKLINRLSASYRKFMGLYRGYVGFFESEFVEKVYPAVAKNSESLDFEIFYVKTFYEYNFYADSSVINRVCDAITRTSDRERQAYLFSEYVNLCRKYKNATKTPPTVNTSLSAPICKSFVDEIINTRSSQAIAKCDEITKGWPNYQSDIYNPTEEVRLYNRLRDLEAKNTRDLFAIIDPYIQKYSNSGNDITYLVLKNFESMKDEESANAIITMIHNHGDYIKQNVNFDTKLNDLLYSRLSSLDAKESIKIADNLINNNASYMQSHLAYDTKIQALYLEKLAELDEGKRNEHIFDAIAQNKKYADKMKQKFRTVETAYTWIKNNSSASYQWTGLIDKYLSCFPTSVHKTELSKLRSTLMDRIREREEDDRRRAEAAAASRNAAAAANPKYGDYVQIEAHFDCGLMCSTPKFIIKGYVRQFLSHTSYNDLWIEVSSVSGKPDVKYTDTDWKTVNDKAKIGKELYIPSGHFLDGGTYQNLTILKRY